MIESKKLSKVLFVDDDEDILTIAKYALKNTPEIEVLVASSGMQALEIALKSHPDLILLDVMMPQMDGVATFEALKKIPTINKTPVVFFTAKVQKNEVEAYFALGALDVLFKPFDPLTLANTMQALWEKYLKKISGGYW
jgi:two-component system OmpR family response regulator